MRRTKDNRQKKSMKVMIMLTVSIIFLIALASSASAYTKYEFFNGAKDNNDNAYDINWMAQTFTVGTVGSNVPFTLYNISLNLAKTGSPPNNLEVNVRAVDSNGKPTGAPIATGTISGALISGSYTYVNVTVSNGLLLPSTQYAIQLNTTGGDVSNFYSWGQTNAGGYSGGQAYTSGSSGGSWSATGVADDDFEVWGNPGAVVLNYPSNNSATINASVVFNASVYPAPNMNTTNATIFVYYLNNSLFNTTTNVLYGNNTQNSTIWILNNLPSNSYFWNVVGCGINATPSTQCLISANNTFYVGVQNATQNFTNTVYETQTAYYNVTFNVTSGTPSAYLWLNGARYASTGSNIAGSQWLFSFSNDTAVGTGSKSLFWEIINGNLNYNTSSNTQTVSLLNMSICGSAPQNVPFLNFTFKNETLSTESVTSTISTNFMYWLGSGIVNKTLAYTSSNENTSYGFCVNPSGYSLNLVGTAQYSNSYSTPRTYTFMSGLLTNITANQTLYLLPTSSGQYSRYKTLTSTQNVISGASVTVTRTIGINTVTIETGYTDSSGLIAFFLNPTITYNYVFSKTGIGSNSFSLIPNSVDTYSIILGSNIGSISNGSILYRNLSYSFTPTNDTLDNSTAYTFSFTANSTTTTITSITMNITNSSGYQLLYSSLAGQGTVQGSLNTADNTTLVGYFTITESNGETITFTHVWTIGQFYAGDYSLFKQLSIFPQYGFRDFTRILLTVSIIVLVMVFLSSREILDTSESKIGVAILLVWIFSLVGWLNTGITLGGAHNFISQFSNQYGIAIITSGIGIPILLRRLFT